MSKTRNVLFIGPNNSYAERLVEEVMEKSEDKLDKSMMNTSDGGLRMIREKEKNVDLIVVTISDESLGEEYAQMINEIRQMREVPIIVIADSMKEKETLGKLNDVEVFTFNSSSFDVKAAISKFLLEKVMVA